MIEFDLTLRGARRPWYQRPQSWLIGLVVAAVIFLPVLTIRALKRRPAKVPNQEQVESAPRERATRTEKAGSRRRPPEGNADRSRIVERLISEAHSQDQKHNYQEARELYYEALLNARDVGTQRRIEANLGRVHTILITTPAQMPEKVAHTVKPGDTLGGLAKRYGTTTELIKRSNGISGHIIRVGDLLRIFSGDLSLTISKSENELVVMLDNKFFKRYQVGTGKFGKTPIGTFIVNDKIFHPDWWRPDGSVVRYGHPDNVLGTHWMALKPTGDTDPVRGYGIHGTWQPNTIGKQESAGCIRLLNSDVEELYALVPYGTVVTITK